MKARTATTGATLIVVMLLTLLMLAVVLAASMRLGLASRQNTGDQKAILQAQYKAETGVNLIRSRLRDYETLLAKDRNNETVVQIRMDPSTMRPALVKAWVEA
ncbi:hypothetical protein [Deinococcus fonticola]|uniref:hypothetical protein n=1 Tax=Deinococcus fonticola TaxID=2528713 RepID=UPI0010754B88|nr:hypothetical protein [Deinococcus fonticola]